MFTTRTITLALILTLSGCYNFDKDWSGDDTIIPPVTIAPAKEHIVLMTQGDPGVSFNGALLVDGELINISGVSPWSIEMHVNIFEGKVCYKSGKGSLGFKAAKKENTQLGSTIGKISAKDQCLRMAYYDGSMIVSRR